MLRKRLKIFIVTALAAVVCLQTPGAQGDEDRPGRYPGLPFVKCFDMPEYPCSYPAESNDWGWLNIAQNGLAGSVTTKQWSRVPLTMTATTIRFGNTNDYDHPDKYSHKAEFFYKVQAFFVSPKGSPNTYGDSALIPVRTVAFGSIPVEVTLQVSQKRDSRGLPLPIVYEPYDWYEDLPTDLPGVQKLQVVEPRPLTTDISVRVRSLKVDGVDLGLGDTCETGPTGRLSVINKRLRAEVPPDWEGAGGAGGANDYVLENFDPLVYHYGAQGGTLSGTIDIPAFSNCHTRSGDDISPILTSAISGDGNPVSVRLGKIACAFYDQETSISIPLPPGVNSFEDMAKINPTACDLNPLAENPKIVSVPKQFDIPTYAPGEQPAP